jgi:hypothetical protein
VAARPGLVCYPGFGCLLVEGQVSCLPWVQWEEPLISQQGCLFWEQQIQRGTLAAGLAQALAQALLLAL